MLKLITALAFSAFAPALLEAQEPVALNVIGLTRDQRLIRFDENTPGAAVGLGPISGLRGGDTALVGIDFRVQDGRLYGVGNAGGVYTITQKNAVATLVNRLKIQLSGTAFGVDFNPATDRLRINSNSGQNLHHDVNPGGTTIEDRLLNYSVGITATGVSGAAYTNNDLDPTTASTLFCIDTLKNQVVIQSPPNNGSLSATGKLGVAAGLSVGFDIHSKIRADFTVSLQALAAIPVDNGDVGLFSINLLTGKSSSRGKFKNQDRLIGLAIPLNQL